MKNLLFKKALLFSSAAVGAFQLGAHAQAKVESAEQTFERANVSISASPVGPYTVVKDLPDNKEFNGTTRWTNKMTDDDGVFNTLHVEPTIDGQSGFSVVAKRKDGTDIFPNQKYLWTVDNDPRLYIHVPSYIGTATNPDAILYKWTVDGAIRYTDIINQTGLTSILPGGGLIQGITTDLHILNPAFRDDFLQQWAMTRYALNPPDEEKIETSTPTKDLNWDLGANYNNFATDPLSSPSIVNVFVTGQNQDDPVLPVGKVKINWTRPKKCLFKVKIYGTSWHVPQGQGTVDILKRSADSNDSLISQVELWTGMQVANVALSLIGAPEGEAVEPVVMELTTTGEVSAEAVADQAAETLESSAADIASEDPNIPDDAEGTTKIEVERQVEPGETPEEPVTKEFTTTKNSNCFVAGTPVLMADGTLKSIEQIKVGDFVESKDPITGHKSAKRVMRTFRNVAPILLTMTLGNGEQITTTPGHPFATSSRGKFVLAGALALKTPLQEFDGGTIPLASRFIFNGPLPIYNFEVQNFHTYFVGKSHVWVHNISNLESTRLEDPFTPEHYIRFDVEKGVLTYTVEAKAAVGAAEDGPTLFDRMWQELMDKNVDVKEIKGDWSNELGNTLDAQGNPVKLNSNLRAFNNYLQNSTGASTIEAAKNTWAYSQAAAKGYTEVTLPDCIGPASNYTHVTVGFRKP